MNKLETIKLILTLISGICWTVVYIDGIRLGIKDRSYAIPFYALALNFAWELLHTIFGLQTGVSVQVVINGCWFMFDVGILLTYFKYGRNYFPRNLPAGAFISWSILGLVTAFGVEFAFIKEFGVAVGAGMVPNHEGMPAPASARGGLSELIRPPASRWRPYA